MMKITLKQSMNDLTKVFLSVLVFSPVMVHAGHIDDEVKALRAEILELKKSCNRRILIQRKI